jgi:hypothetical protein
MLIMVSRGNSLELKLGFGFLIEPPLKSSPIDQKNVIVIQKRGNIFSQICSQILEPLCCDVVGSFAIYGNRATITHLPHKFTPTNTCPTENSNDRCLGYVAFECHANFHICWESFAHRDRHKKHV